MNNIFINTIVKYAPGYPLKVNKEAPRIGPMIFPHILEKLSTETALTILRSPTISKIPVRLAGSSKALENPFNHDATRMCQTTKMSTEISENKTIAVITLRIAPKISRVFLLYLSASNPVNMENIGRGTLFINKNIPK